MVDRLVTVGDDYRLPPAVVTAMDLPSLVSAQLTGPGKANDTLKQLITLPKCVVLGSYDYPGYGTLFNGLRTLYTTPTLTVPASGYLWVEIEATFIAGNPNAGQNYAGNCFVNIIIAGTPVVLRRTRWHSMGFMTCIAQTVTGVSRSLVAGETFKAEVTMYVDTGANLAMYGEGSIQVRAFQRP